MNGGGGFYNSKGCGKGEKAIGYVQFKVFLMSFLFFFEKQGRVITSSHCSVFAIG